MEFQVLSTKGIPNDAILSVRAGQTRRQVSLPHEGKSILFPCLPLSAKPFKIDVLMPVATYQMELKPDNNKYDVAIGDKMSVNFAVKEAVEHCGKTSSDFRHGTLSPRDSLTKQRLGAALTGREYLDKHDLFQFFQEMMKHIMTEQPTDPHSFMVTYLTRKQVAKEGMVMPKPTAPTPPTLPTAPSMPKPDVKASPRESKQVTTLHREELEELKQKTKELLAATMDSGRMESLMAGKLDLIPRPTVEPAKAAEPIAVGQANEAELNGKTGKILAEGLEDGILAKEKPPASNPVKVQPPSDPASDLSGLPTHKLRLKAIEVLEHHLETGALIEWEHTPEPALSFSKESIQEKLESALRSGALGQPLLLGSPRDEAKSYEAPTEAPSPEKPTEALRQKAKESLLQGFASQSLFELIEVASRDNY